MKQNFKLTPMEKPERNAIEHDLWYKRNKYLEQISGNAYFALKKITMTEKEYQLNIILPQLQLIEAMKKLEGK